ncbi:MAG: Chromate resistance protein ChrB [Nitrolancea sp.]
MSKLTWMLLVYRVPTEPASRRVTVWRELKRLGSLYLQQCVCILPDRPDLRTDVERIVEKIDAFEGQCTLFEIPHLRPADEEHIVESFRSLRNKEYREIVEECETKFVKEIEFEHFRQNYTFEEAEEIGQDLEKIRRWFDRIVARDWFDASGRKDVEGWIERCADLLSEFEHEVYKRSPDDVPGDGSELLRSPIVPRLVARDDSAERSVGPQREETGS